MQIIGLLGIFLALILFIVLVYKGCLSYWAVMICVAVVALTNQMNLLEAFTGTFLNGLTELIFSLFSIIFLGAIFGRLFSDTGAASSIANFLINRFLPEDQAKNKVFTAVLILFIFSGLCTMGGIDGYIAIFTLVPIFMLVAKRCDIPRRFVAGMMFLNCMFMAAPGAPQIHNIMAVVAMNSASGAAVQEGAAPFFVNSTAGLIPGWIAVVVISVLSLSYLPRAIKKAQAAGEHFDAGPVQLFERDDKNTPNVIFAILPLVSVFISYAIFHLDIFWALLIGITLTVIFMGRHLPKVDSKQNRIHFGRQLVTSLNAGAGNYPNALMSIITPTGLAAVITATASFGMIIGIVHGLSNVLPIVVVALIGTCVIVALTSSPPAALMIVIPNIIIPIMLAKGMDVAAHAGAITRIAAISASTFESLPFNGLCVILMAILGTTTKEAYRPMFIISVCFTLTGALVCTALCLLFPGLAMIG